MACVAEHPNAVVLNKEHAVLLPRHHDPDEFIRVHAAASGLMHSHVFLPEVLVEETLMQLSPLPAGRVRHLSSIWTRGRSC